MRLKIEKLGPVMDSEIEFGDVTLFLGPPNTGKSYTLRAIYAKLFPLDDYALDIVEKRLSSALRRHIEQELSEPALSVFYNLYKVLVGIFTVTAFLPRKDRTDEKLKELIKIIAEKYGFEVTEIQDGSQLVDIEAPPMEVHVKAETLKQILQKVFLDFIGDIVPLESPSSVVFEPIDILELHVDYAIETLEYEAKIKAERVPPWIDDLFEYMSEFIIREAVIRHKIPRRILVFPLARYLRYLLSNLGIELNLKTSIKPTTDTIKILLTLTLSLRPSIPTPAFQEEVLESISLETIEKIVDEVFEKSKSNTRLRRIVDRVVLGLRGTILKACTDKMSRNILKDRLREILRNQLGYDSLRFVPFGRSILVLGLESASREPFTRPEFLRSFVKEFYPSILASYVYWASKGRSQLLEGKLSEKQARLLKAITPLLEGKLFYDAAGRLLYKDWRGSIVDFRMSSALVEEVSGLVFALLSADDNAIVLVEEPEAQLHPGAQIIMALFLASLPSLCGCRVVASTHSDLLAITLSQLAVQKPSREWVKELLEKLLEELLKKLSEELLPHMKEGIDVLAEAVAEAAENLDLKVYEFTREGKVRPTKPKDVLGKEVPGISRIIDELTDWAFRLASYRASKKAG